MRAISASHQIWACQGRRGGENTVTATRHAPDSIMPGYPPARR